MSLRTRGLCVGRVNFGNTSQVITLLSPDRGLLGLLAKGVWRPRNPLFHGPFEVTTLYEIVFVNRRRSELGLVTEAAEIECFRGLRSSRERLNDAFLVVQFVRQFGVPEEIDAGLFDLLLGTFRALAAGRGEALPSFLAGALRLAGLFPSLERCASCGRPRREAPSYGFSFQEGGIVCRRDAGGADRRIARGVIAALEAPETAAGPLRDACVRILVDWSNYVVASRSRVLEYPFYLREPARGESVAGRAAEKR